MKTYRVEITWNGRWVTEIIGGNNTNDVIQVVKLKYPGCGIFRVTEMK